MRECLADNISLVPLIELEGQNIRGMQEYSVRPGAWLRLKGFFIPSHSEYMSLVDSEMKESINESFVLKMVYNSFRVNEALEVCRGHVCSQMSLYCAPESGDKTPRCVSREANIPWRFLRKFTLERQIHNSNYS